MLFSSSEASVWFGLVWFGLGGSEVERREERMRLDGMGMAWGWHGMGLRGLGP